MNEKSKFWILAVLLALSIALLYFANTSLDHNILLK